MSTATDAFERLGIAPTRDARTIKRAYAVALKAIDQAHEREAFERLRQAYEQALAWAARADEQDDDNDNDNDNDNDEEEEEEEEDDQADPEDGEDREDEAEGDTDDQAGPDAPGAPVAPPPAGQAPAAPVPAPQRPDDLREALRHWTDRLRDAPAGDVAAVLDAALADPRLLHLDSHAQLEARIAGLLHENPVGRAALFDAAAARFHWNERNARPIAGTAAAHWISRVVNQGLQWSAQAPAAITLQQQALDTVTRVPSPQAEQARRFAEVLEHMADDFPDWFALRLGAQGHAHRPAWQAVYARLAPRWARQAERKARYFGTRRKTANTLVGGLFVLILATAVLSGVMNRLLGGAAPPAAVAAPARGTPPNTPEAVLAYEFTGAVTRDSCESAEEFVHGSNWLQVDDSDAVALLATRAIRCQDKGLWSRKDDTLMACLRAERAAALAGGRPEEAQRCLKLDAAGR